MQHDQRPYLQGAEWEALSDIGQALTQSYLLPPLDDDDNDGSNEDGAVL